MSVYRLSAVCRYIKSTCAMTTHLPRPTNAVGGLPCFHINRGPDAARARGNEYGCLWHFRLSCPFHSIAFYAKGGLQSRPILTACMSSSIPVDLVSRWHQYIVSPSRGNSYRDTIQQSLAAKIIRSPTPSSFSNGRCHLSGIIRRNNSINSEQSRPYIGL